MSMSEKRQNFNSYKYVNSMRILINNLHSFLLTNAAIYLIIYKNEK